MALSACPGQRRRYVAEGADASVCVDELTSTVLKYHHLTSTFLRELAALRAVQTPEIVRLYAFCISDQVLYLERHDCDLLTYLQDDFRALNPYQAEAFQLQASRALLRALVACHAAGIVHNDVKLENLLVSKEPLRVVLADFGRAGSSDDGLGGTSGVKGTRVYMAPEVFDSAATPASDCWSAGVVCFACMEQQMPFDDVDGSGPLEYSLPEKRRGWPAWATALVDGLLQLSPASRISSGQALELLDRLGQAHTADARTPSSSSSER